MRRRIVPLLALLLAACATTPKPPPAPAPAPQAAAAPRPDPWNGPAFTADPEELLRAAAELPPPPDATAEALVAEATVRLDPAGDTIVARRVIRTLPKLGPGQGSIALGWDPRHEERPEPRARAIWPDGTVRWMEPVDFDDVALDDGTRALRTELPVAPGMVIEQVSTVRRRPAPAVGGRLAFSAGMPTRLARIVVDAPPDAPVRAVARGVDAPPRDVLAGGRRVISFELAPVPPEREVAFPPPELEPVPSVEWTGAAGWADAVGPSADALEAALAGAGADALLAGVDRRGPPAAVAARLLARLRGRLAIDPAPLAAAALAAVAPPAATLAAGRAGAADAAVALAAALRAAGVPADLAIARESGADPLPELPAIHGDYRVLLALPDGAFLDPAYPEAPWLPVPAAVEGRTAVRLSRARPGPVPVPSSPAAASRSTVTREVRFGGRGPARIVETVEGTGHLAAAYRAAWAEGGLERFRATVGDLEGWALGGKAEAFRVEPGAPGRPFRARFEVKRARGATRGPDGATVRLPPTALFFRLPLAQEGARDVDVVLPFAHVALLTTRVFAPPGLAPAEPPPTTPAPFGPLVVRRSATARPDRVETALSLDVDRRRFAPREISSMIDDAAVLALSAELRLAPRGRAARATGTR